MHYTFAEQKLEIGVTFGKFDKLLQKLPSLTIGLILLGLIIYIEAHGSFISESIAGINFFVK